MQYHTLPYPYNYYSDDPATMLGRGRKKDPFRKMSRGFSKAVTAINPLSYKPVQKFGTQLGKFTNEELLPIVKTVGIPMASAAMGALGTTFGGPMGGIMASQLTDSLLKEYVPGQSKSKYAQMLGDIATMGMTGEVDPMQLMEMQSSLLAPKGKKKTMPVSTPQRLPTTYNPDYPYQDLINQILNTYPLEKPLSEPVKQQPEIINYNALSDALYKDGRLGLGADSVEISAPPYQQREGSMSGLLGSGVKKRGRPKKKVVISDSEEEEEIYVKRKPAYKKFSHAKNKALEQYLEATEEKKSKEAKKAFEKLVKQQSAALTAAGYGISKPIKGSSEMKERMAKLRAMRKSKK